MASKRIVVGFDGYVDTITRPVRQSATDEAPAKVFETIKEFGEFLVGCAEKSCSIELKVEAEQLGGNLPFLSRSAGRLGLDVTCIGMLGEDGMIEQTFQDMPCTLYSFAASGKSTAFEFRDGKIDHVTDVLSFPQYENAEEMRKVKGVICLGDVVICPEQALLQAEEFGHSGERELVYLFVHSVFHLLGYDHMEEESKSEMRAQEEKIMSQIGLIR